MTVVHTSRRRSVALLAVALMLGAAASAHAGGNAIEMKNGYFWDPVVSNYWVPHGFSYQVLNPPVYATQTPEQIDYDFLEMKKMHVDSIRTEFPWGNIEKTNGVIDWTATDFIIATAQKYGLRVFILIGYQYPPAWFSNDWKNVNSQGGVSDVINYEHPLARAAYSSFISRVTAHYKDSPTIAGWTLGNEYAYFDLWETNDPHRLLGYETNYCRASFINYLTNLYSGSIAALNGNWGTAYATFNDTVMPTNYPGALDPGNVDLQNRLLPAYYDLTEWRKKSIGDFVAIGAVAAKSADTNHLCSYSMVGGIFSGFDANYTCEDAKTIVARCAAAGAPLDFWSINNYAWASQGNELRSAQFGITKYRAQSGLPVLVTETGHSSTENLFPGASPRQPVALPGQVWEAVMAGAIGVHIFTWNDRPFGGVQIREAGFGIVQTNRMIKNPVYWNIQETFRRMEQVNVSTLLGGSRNPAPDIFFYWSKDSDMTWSRANQENTMLWGGLKRLGYEPGFLDEDGYDAQAYTNAKALLLSHAFMMASNRIDALTNVIAKGVNVHSSGVLPGRYNSYHKDNPGWAATISNVFGLTAGSATNFWHGGISGPWDQPYTLITFQYLNTLGPLNASYPWTNASTWIRQDGITANSGTTIVQSIYDYYGNRTNVGLQIKSHGSQGKAAINTWTLGDTLKFWWMYPEPPEELAWQLHFDWGKAIYRTWFGMTPAVDLSGSTNFYVIPDYRLCTNGSVLISLLNESTNPATITLTATGLLTTATIEQLSPAAGILETNSDGVLNFTLAGDQYVLLYAYTNGHSLVSAGPARVWMASEPPGGIWPNGRPVPVSIGYDTRGANLDLYLALERCDGTVIEFARTNVTGVAGIGTNTLNLPVTDADLGNGQYVSTLDGATYRLHAWLQNGSTTQGECVLSTRLLWGVRPTSLPSSVSTGQTYSVTVNWQELPSYQSSEVPTPLSRADVWQTSLSNAQTYTVYLDLMTGSVAVASSNFVMSTGTGSNQFSVTVPAGVPPGAAWRARLLTGSAIGATSNNHDLIDGFEDRGRGAGTQFISPWVDFAFDQNSAIQLWAEGVHPIANEGTNGAFVIANNPNPGGYSGFGMTYDFGTTWALPNPSLWSNISFAFDFIETNVRSGTLTMKVEDPVGAIEYTTNYVGPGWQTISAKLSKFHTSAFPGTFDSNHIKKLTVMLQSGTQTGVYFSTFDHIMFTGTPWIVTAPPSGNDDLKTSFEDLSQGQYVNPTPWSLNSYNSGTENNYLSHGVDSFASDGTKGFFAVYSSHTNVAGYSGFYLHYVFPNAPFMPTNLAQARFSADFYETNGRSCTLELQLKSADGGLSKYTNTYNHIPGTWFTIGANVNAFAGTADMNNLTEMNVLCQMNTAGGLAYVAHFDNINFTGTLSSVGFTNGLYLSINDSGPLADTDGDGIPDIYETNTGVWNGPTDTGTNPNVADSDGDGLRDGDEVIAGSNPNSSSSVYEIDHALKGSASGMVIEWFARTNKIYTVYHLDGNLATGTFTPLGSFTNITVPTDGYTNVVDATTTNARFYRVDVRLP